MKNFLIMANDRGRRGELLSSMVDAIMAKGGSAQVCDGNWMRNPEELSVDPGAECIITVGGDGTVISAAKIAIDQDIPLVGVNRGHLGYLCDLDEESVFTAIDDLMADRFVMEERMLLSGHVESDDGGREKQYRALNDVVVSSGAGLQVIHMRIYINGEYLYSFNGDGMIFATPTGSTAYNMSAKGPIVDPKTDVILMTPINPHTLNTRSFVLDPSDRITLEIANRHEEDRPDVVTSFDGMQKGILTPGKKLIVRKAKAKVRMIRFTDMSFLERIRRKMNDIGG